MRPIDKTKHILVLSLIETFHIHDGRNPSYLDFILECGMGSDTVAHVLRRLENQGVLKINRGHGRRRNEYTMNGGMK